MPIACSNSLLLSPSPFLPPSFPKLTSAFSIKRKVRNILHKISFPTGQSGGWRPGGGERGRIWHSGLSCSGRNSPVNRHLQAHKLTRVVIMSRPATSAISRRSRQWHGGWSFDRPRCGRNHSASYTLLTLRFFFCVFLFCKLANCRAAK